MRGLSIDHNDRGRGDQESDPHRRAQYTKPFVVTGAVDTHALGPSDIFRVNLSPRIRFAGSGVEKPINNRGIALSY